MSWLSISLLPLIWVVLHYSALGRMVVARDQAFFCSRHVYDNPALQDCSHVLAALPQADPFYRYYIEPQLKSAPPYSDWEGWKDDRGTLFRQRVIQVPRFWSHGSCNLALLSYVEGDSKKALSFSRWADVYLSAYNLLQACLNLHSQGGAATVIDITGQATLTVFLWRNGASFETTMNKYTSAAFPAGIDPRYPAILKTIGTFNGSVNSFNDTLLESINLGDPTSLEIS